MARVVTPPMPTTTTTTTKQTTPPVAVPPDKIAKRAFEKWIKRGCQHGNDQRDWFEAEAELKAEAGRTAPSSTPPRR
jgi:hypothetical protein